MRYPEEVVSAAGDNEQLRELVLLFPPSLGKVSAAARGMADKRVDLQQLGPRNDLSGIVPLVAQVKIVVDRNDD